LEVGGQKSTVGVSDFLAPMVNRAALKGISRPTELKKLPTDHKNTRTHEQNIRTD
jgi:hypothetical protein